MAKRDKPPRRGKPSVGRKGSAPPARPVLDPSARADPSSGSQVSGLHYWSGGHTRHRILVHLVFCPKYRHRVLEGSLATRLAELFQECCTFNEWFLHELNVQSDHVHLLVQFSPSERICDVVQRLKGGSGHTLRVEFPDLKEFFWGSSFWSDGYFCESVGYRDEATIRRYIREQRKVIGSEDNLSLDFGESGS
jgi:putative transposase